VTIPTATSEQLYLRLGDEYFESPGGHIRIFRPRELARRLAGAGGANARRRRFRREPGWAHPDLPAARARARARGGRARDGGGRLRARLPHALLGAALGGPGPRGPRAPAPSRRP